MAILRASASETLVFHASMTRVSVFCLANACALAQLRPTISELASRYLMNSPRDGSGMRLTQSTKSVSEFSMAVRMVPVLFFLQSSVGLPNAPPVVAAPLAGVSSDTPVMAGLLTTLILRCSPSGRLTSATRTPSEEASAGKVMPVKSSRTPAVRATRAEAKRFHSFANFTATMQIPHRAQNPKVTGSEM